MLADFEAGAMNKLLYLFLTLLLLVVPTLAQQQPSSRKLAVLADFSDRKQFALENQLFGALQKLEASGRLSGIDLGDSPLVINTGQSDGKALLSNWGLKLEDLPVLAIAEVREGEAPALLWYWQVTDVPAAIHALEGELGLDSQISLPVIRAADFNPRSGPLSAGTTIRFTLQGTPGGSATAEIGGVSGIPLFELESGLYKGEYQVKADDRLDAAVNLHLTAHEGGSVSRFLGHILLQGVQAPHLQSARQISSGEWLVSGTAPPNSQVSVQAVVTQSLIFKFRSTSSFQGMADANGQFQLTAFIEDNVAGSEATFTATATLGNVSETSEQKLTFQGLRNFPGSSPGGNPSFSPWSLAGRWYHGNRATNIRVNGRDSVVITNEFRQETTLTLQWPNRLVSRDANPLRGKVEGNTIFWNNGTRWDRSMFR